jgi:hypothetical protein
MRVERSCCPAVRREFGLTINVAGRKRREAKEREREMKSNVVDIASLLEKASMQEFRRARSASGLPTNSAASSQKVLASSGIISRASSSTSQAPEHSKPSPYSIDIKPSRYAVPYE